MSISILCNHELSHQFDFAGRLLKYFVLQGARLYGREFLVYNVHSLLHLADQAKRFGSLDECSAFAFESFLGRLKRLVVSGKNPLAQVVHHLDTAMLPGRFTKHDSITCKIPNNAFIVDGKGCEVLAQVGEQRFQCRVFLNIEPLFEHPIESTLLGKFVSSSTYTSSVILPRDQLTQRAIMFPHTDRMCFLALGHSFSEI